MGEMYEMLKAAKIVNADEGTSIKNCFVGLFILPKAQYDTLVVETGFAPKIVGAWVYDEVNELNTFTVVYGITTGNQDGKYFQDGGYNRKYTADGNWNNNEAVQLYSILIYTFIIIVRNDFKLYKPITLKVIINMADLTPVISNNVL